MTGDGIPNDPATAAERGKAAHSPMSFLFTITADDLDAFLKNPYRRAELFGTVEVPALSSGQLQVKDGAFDLLVPNPDRVGMVNMTYTATLQDTEGRTFFLAAARTSATTAASTSGPTPRRSTSTSTPASTPPAICSPAAS